MVSSPPVTDIDPSVFFKNCLRREAAKKAMVHNIQCAKKKMKRTFPGGALVPARANSYARS